MLKWLEAMIDVQKQVREMMKIAEEVNTTITEMEGTILKVSQIRYSLVVILELNSVSEIQYKDMMIDR